MLVWMKSLGAVDRAVHMGFRGEAEDRPRLVIGEQAGYQLAIADIAGDEGAPASPSRLARFCRLPA